VVVEGGTGGAAGWGRVHREDDAFVAWDEQVLEVDVQLAERRVAEALAAVQVLADLMGGPQRPKASLPAASSSTSARNPGSFGCSPTDRRSSATTSWATSSQSMYQSCDAGLRNRERAQLARPDGQPANPAYSAIAGGFMARTSRLRA
jgi:hypothetical protein